MQKGPLQSENFIIFFSFISDERKPNDSKFNRGASEVDPVVTGSPTTNGSKNDGKQSGIGNNTTP